MISFKSFSDLYNKIKKESLGIKREDMPQIESAKAQDFIKFLKDKGISVKQTKVSSSLLKATQKEMDINKLMDFANNRGVKEMGKKPAFVSKDNYVLDGHHRVFAVKLADPAFKFPVYRVDLKIRDLLSAANEWPGVFHKALAESNKP